MNKNSNTFPGFFIEGGMVGQLMREHDWSASSLGDPCSWPQPLQTVISLMLNSKTPMFLAWGAELSLFYNDAYAAILGPKHPAALARPLPEVWPETWRDMEALVNKTLAGASSYHENVPFTRQCQDRDEQTWISFSYSPVRDLDGSVAGLFCSLTETTAHILAEKNSQAETKRLYDLFEQAPSFMAVLRGPDHVYELVNSAYHRTVGSRQLVGKSLREAFPEIEGQGYFELMDKVYESGEPFIGQGLPVTYPRHPGEPPTLIFADFIYQPIFGPDGKVTGIFHQGHDVTNHKHTEEKLRESEAKFRTIADAMPQIVWSTRADGFHDYYNQQWYAYTGVAEGSTDGEKWLALLHPEDQERAKQRWRHSLDTGQTYELEFRLRHHSGQYRWTLGRALPVHDDQGAIVRWMGTGTDIHEHRLAQEMLLRSDQRKDEFLAMLAHELRNPLAPIAAAADLLSMGKLNEARMRQISEVIARQSKHMTSLIDDLLDVSRVTRGLVKLDRKPVDLKSIVVEAVEQVRPLLEARAHHLETHMSSERAVISGDKKRLIQILANLLSNAVKYTGNGGSILLKLDVREDEIILSVRDNGIGMSADLVERAFELFTQGERTSDRSQGGLGIGLALVKSLVQLHGGRVMAQSGGAGLGSEFSVSLPRLHDAREQCRSEGGNSSICQTGEALRVMVVDDNIDAAQLLGMFLEEAGHKVFLEYQPIKAIDRARAISPQVCLLDIGLPDIDGNELARRLRALPGMAEAVLVAVTGYGQPQDREAAFAAGFNEHLVKPVDTKKLAALLADIAKNQT